MKQYPIIFMSKAQAATVCGSISQTSKMPCKSSSLPTVACHTGFKMAKIAGSICSHCYADKGFYAMYANAIQPAQHARLDSVIQAMGDPELGVLWVSAMVAHIGSDPYFRHHDSGDLQGVEHLRLICQVCEATPNTMHWLPTREYGMVKEYISLYGAIPANLTIRLSAMYPDVPVKMPKSLENKGLQISNVHKSGKPLGLECKAYKNDGKCGTCRECFYRDNAVSYKFH